MASWPLPFSYIVISLFLVLFLPFIPHRVQCLGSMATLAASYDDDAGISTVCGVSGGRSSAFRCVTVSHRNVSAATAARDIWTNVSFLGLAAGNDTICALTEVGGHVVCWDTLLRRPKRISGNNQISQIAVGDRQVCGLEESAESAVCWRWNGSGRNRPPTQTFRSLTSGGNFSCGILSSNSSVVCWGPGASGVAGLAGWKMAVISAGSGHLCGIGADDGVLRCVGSNDSGQLRVPVHKAFQFDELALGNSHTCARFASNESVLCWGGIGKAPGGLGLISIVAGNGFSCGVVVSNNSVVCWGGDFGDRTDVNLTNVLPQPCQRSSSPCDCGEYPNWQTLCPVSHRMCRPCPLGNNGSSPAAAPAPARTVYVTKKKLNRPATIALAVAGGAGMLTGVATLASFAYRKFRPAARRSGRVHDPEHAETSPSTETSPNGAVRRTLPARPFSRRPSRRAASRQRSRGSVDGPVEFTFAEMSQATSGFSAENRIGGGSFGTVYRGKLADGREVAIKRGGKGGAGSGTGTRGGTGTGGDRETDTAFETELWFLSRLHHKHLLGLVGYCEDEGERLLVYDYMPNGTLYDHLHRAELGRYGVLLRGPLGSWAKRIRVALDAARGVEYLHTYAVPPIIHRDIKSSNILLDSAWNALVSDFGLSLPGTGDSIVSAEAAGTLGYMDPEYYRTHRLTPKSDVYSFGVLLLEILSGRKAIHRSTSGSHGRPRNVVDVALAFLADNDLPGLLDHRMPLPGPHEIEALSLVCHVAVQCVTLEGRYRPSMTDVAAVLERALVMCQRHRAHPPSPALDSSDSHSPSPSPSPSPHPQFQPRPRALHAPSLSM